MTKPTLLIPVVFPEPEVYPLDNENIVGLSGFDIVLFGYWELPEGVSRETARATHEAEAQAVLYEMAAEFSRGGASTSVQLYFGAPGSEEAAIQERIVTETDADAVLAVGHITMWNNVLVPLRDAGRQDDIVEFLGGFDTESIFVFELYHAALTPDEVGPATEMLENVKKQLLQRGYTENEIEVTVERRDDVARAISDRAQQHNLVVMGETEELSAESRFLGPMYQAIADQAGIPIVVVRE